MKAIEMLEDIIGDGFGTLFDEMTENEAKQWIIEAHNELKTIKELVENCNGDESDCRILYDKLYEIIIEKQE